jgi:superfamily II DNA/RNA helicase
MSFDSNHTTNRRGGTFTKSFGSNNRTSEGSSYSRPRSENSGYSDRSSSSRDDSDRSSYGGGSRGGYSDRGSRGGYSDRGSRGGYSGGGRSGGGFRGGNRGGGRNSSPSLNQKLYTASVKSIEEQETEVKETYGLFSDLPLSKKVQDAIAARGYVSPTQIQAKVIAHVIDKKDVVAISQTGSGKTAAFLLPILNEIIQNLDNGINKPTALVIAPTRELAFQIDKEFRLLVPRSERIFSLVCTGGMSIRDQIYKLSKTNHLVVGTPGRLLDLYNQGVLKLGDMQVVVLDEMDRMLDMGFKDDIEAILNATPKQRQSLYFSATQNRSLKPILNRLSPDAVYVTVNEPKPSEFVEQSMLRVGGSRDAKIEALVNLLKEDEKHKSLIFVNTKREVETIADALYDEGFSVDHIHGDKTQDKRLKIIRRYRENQFQVLVATDVAARGLDVSDVTLVVNYDEPKTEDEYIHRVGRTGRAGKYGKAVTFVR